MGFLESSTVAWRECRVSRKCCSSSLRRWNEYLFQSVYDHIKAGASPRMGHPRPAYLYPRASAFSDEQSICACRVSSAVEAGSTVHLVRSQARPAPAPAATSPGAATTSAFGNPGTGAHSPGSGMGAGNPFAGMMGNMGGGMDINRMQQQLMSNPEMMANIMNSPMMEVGGTETDERLFAR